MPYSRSENELVSAVMSGRLLVTSPSDTLADAAHRMADRPDNNGKTQRQKQAEKRARNGYDDFIERRNFRQSGPVHIRLALNYVHRRKLRQRDEASERQRPERVLDAVDCLFPERFPEPDPKFFYVKPSPARSQKMPKFVDYN